MTCECGNEITRKNAAGHYRDKCWDCIKESVPESGHVAQCESDECLICCSWLDEAQQAIRPLFIHIRYQLQWNPETPQETIQNYE